MNLESFKLNLTGGDTVEHAIRDRRCMLPPAGCGESVPSSASFKDLLSQREYLITGLCQKCQDAIFDTPEE